MECDTDVPIYRMYEAAYDTEVHKIQNGQLILGMQPRTMQQRVGPIIMRINQKLPPDYRIVPGRLKQTYRLETPGR